MGRTDVFSIIDFFNDMWRDENFFGTVYNPQWYSAPSFPPVDVLIDKKTKDIVFDFAIAGFSDDEIDITFSGDYLSLKLEQNNKISEDDFKTVHKGISKQNVSWRYYVPADKYDQEKVEANLKNGILTVKIPAREEAQKKKIVITK